MITKHKIRMVAAAAIAIALAGSLAACRGSDNTTSTGKAPSSYTVTVGTDLSSAFSSACCGIPIANGFKTYMDTLNDKGGVNGKTKVNVVSLDDQADVTTGLANFQQALSSNTLGYFLTSASTVLTPIAAQATKAGIATSSIGGYMGGVGVYPYVYNSLPNSASYVSTVTKFAAAQVSSASGSGIDFLAYDSTLVETFQKDMTSKLNSDGWKVGYNQLVPSSATDFSVAAGSMAADHPKVIITDLLEGQLPTFVQQIRSHGVTVPIVNFSSNIDDATVAKINDPNLYLVEFTAPTSDTSNKAIATMQAQAQKAGLTTGDSNAFFVTGYVQAEIVAAALKKCAPDCTRKTFNAAMNTTTVPGNGLMAGNPGFSPTNHVMVKKLIVVKYDSSKQLPVTVSGFGL
ncbi:MAG TPA: ABC transporter substrate-binding protein [Galbitalea sp.]|nr:ABC transporter substrate-binding protein [Galbitalea sp.]